MTMRIKALILLFVCLLAYALSGCSAEKRIARIARNHNITQVETRTITDTVIRPEFVTSYAMPLSGSMFAHYDHKLAVVGMVRGDTVYVTLSQKADTVIVTRDVPVEVIRYSDNNMPLLLKIGIVAVIAFGGLFLVLIVKMLEKK